MRALPRRARIALWTGLIVAVGLRIWVAFATYGVQYDINSLKIMASALDAAHPLHAYATFRWPYPGGYLPVDYGLLHLASGLHLPFQGVVQLPAILADAAIAWVVQDELGRRGASPGARLAAAGLVAFGPMFFLISGFHGQIDSVAILFGLLGLVAWERGVPRRALVAGLLIGIGASIKTVPFFLVFALLPTASWRERGELLAAAVLVPVLATAPFLLADGHDTLKALRANHGVPGWGSYSLLVQPGLAGDWLLGHAVPVSRWTARFTAHQNLIVGLGVLAAAAYAWFRRLPPLTAAVIIWLAVYVSNPNLNYEYLVWGPPFFILAGYLWPVAVFQVALAPFAAALYFHWQVGTIEPVYAPGMVLIWAAAIAALVAVLLTRARTASPP